MEDKKTEEWKDTDSIPALVERSRAAATGVPVDAGVVGLEPDDPADYKAMYEKALDAFKKLRAYLITKGVGHNAIKRILKGEVVSRTPLTRTEAIALAKQNRARVDALMAAEVERDAMDVDMSAAAEVEQDELVRLREKLKRRTEEARRGR